MRAVVFSGPSLPPSKAPAVAGLEWRGPARQGDVYQAALSRPAIVGLVDGLFEAVPAVWHKEILWAMAQGIHVYGAASIGALRAAELADFGMKGIGRVFQLFHAGALQDDDEVAVLHGPEAVDYVELTEAMVNVRATLERAVRLSAIDADLSATVCRVAKLLFYKDRTYEAILNAATEQIGNSAALERFRSWLPQWKVNQKQKDALEMIKCITDHLASGVTPMQIDYDLARTFSWEQACQSAERQIKAPQTSVDAGS